MQAHASQCSALSGYVRVDVQTCTSMTRLHVLFLSPASLLGRATDENAHPVDISSENARKCREVGRAPTGEKLEV